MAAAPTWELRLRAQLRRADQARQAAARDPRGAAGAHRRRVRADAGGGHRPAPVVGPLPRQAEDRDVHAAREDPERDPHAARSCARSARSPTRYGRGDAELTTRQCIQLHWLELAALPDVFADLEAAGITSAGGCGDTVRNITGCPVSGLAADELFDATPVVEGATAEFYGNPAWANLPRKHKYSIASCADRCNAPEINCVSLVGVVQRRPRGLRGAGRRRPRVRSAHRARPRRLRADGGGERDPRRGHDGVERGPEVPHVAREGAAEVHGRRHRRRGHARARRGEARPHARALRAAADRRAAVRAHRRARAEAGRALVHRRARAARAHVGRPADRRRRSRRVVRRRHPPDAPAEPDRHRRLRRRVDDARAARRARPAARDERDLGQLDRLHRRAALQLLRRRDEGPPARPRRRISRRRSATQIAELRLHLDGCPHACAQHWVGDLGFQATTGKDADGQPHLGVRHLRARLARARRRRSAARSSGACASERLEPRGRGARARLARRSAPTARRSRRSSAACPTTSSAPSRASSRRRNECERRRQREHLRAARRAGGRRAVDPVRRRGAAGAARVGDRGVQPAPRDLGGVPGRRRRADRHGVQDRPERAHLHGRHRPAAARDARADRRAAREVPGPQPRTCSSPTPAQVAAHGRRARAST